MRCLPASLTLPCRARPAPSPARRPCPGRRVPLRPPRARPRAPPPAPARAPMGPPPARAPRCRQRRGSSGSVCVQRMAGISLLRAGVLHRLTLPRRARCRNICLSSRRQLCTSLCARPARARPHTSFSVRRFQLTTHEPTLSCCCSPPSPTPCRCAPSVALLGALPLPVCLLAAPPEPRLHNQGSARERCATDRLSKRACAAENASGASFSGRSFRHAGAVLRDC